MYLPKAHEELDTAVMHDLIRRYPLGCTVTNGRLGLTVNHIPFLIDPHVGAHGMLRAHVARANPVWQEAGAEAVAIFQGPDGYISPNWYPSKHQTGKAVPTWNYAVVHAHGRLRVIEDKAWLLQLVTELTNTHERSQQLAWQVNDAPQDYLERMLEMIVGIEIPIERLVGKWKVSQNRSDEDRAGVAAGLATHEGGLAMAELVKVKSD